jgi:hypothetical protein
MSEILNAPHKIYLNIKEEHEDGEVIDFFDCQEITWSEDPALDVTLGFISIESYEATSKELEELQDAIANLSTQIEFSGDPNCYYFEGVYRETDKGSNKIIYNAIQESHNRRKNNE